MYNRRSDSSRYSDSLDCSSLGGSGDSRSNVGRSSSSSSSSSSRVICTHFYRKGMLEPLIWRADMEFTFKHLSATTVRGYHLWAIPYVRLMRTSAFAEKIMLPLAQCRAQELAYQMGVVNKGSWRGKLVRLIFEPMCFCLGVFVGEQNWESLYQSAR